MVISVLLGLLSCVYTESCPTDYEVYPCMCEEDDESGDIKVSCSAQGTTLPILKQALSRLIRKRNVQLELSNFKLGAVPSYFFYGIEIKKLKISRCDLDSLTDDGRPALIGLEYSLEELHILSSYRKENKPAKLQLGHLRKLREINLSYNVIRALDDDWFDRGPASLEYLTISNNGIEKVDERAFANLINLKKLSFDGNRFGTIRRSMLPYPARRLDTLELDNNVLTTVPEDIFSNMPALTSISLRSNRILRLDQRTWYPVWQQLNAINLEGNPIECDSHMNWIFNLRRTAAINGHCISPPERYGKRLQEFIDSRSRVRLL